MTSAARLLLSIIFCALAPAAAHAEWKAVEKIETYKISGKTGAALYASIGERGPVVRDDMRTIAHTNFKLTWSRNYVKKDGACVLASARPNLTITYTLPKPAEKLDGAVRKNWEAFFAGIQAHERVHGDLIKTLVKEIEAATVGMTVAGDPGCKTIKTELKNRLSKLFEGYKLRNRDFEQAEMGAGGNIQRLILALVNGA